MKTKITQNPLLASWERHNIILLNLLKAIPKEALIVKPIGSRGRDVARQFIHLARVREGWAKYFITGKRPKVKRIDKGAPPKRKEITEMLKNSGGEVKDTLSKALNEEIRIRYFKQDVFRWYTYLIEHESHHRGQILLALKQNNFILPDEVKLKGIWGKWIFGK